MTSLFSLSERFPNENVPRGLKSLWMCHANGLDTMMLLQWKRCRATSKLGPSEPFQPPARDSLFKSCFIRAADSHKEHPISEALEVCQENEPGLLWHPPFCTGRQPCSYNPCSPELGARLPLCLFSYLMCRRRPVCIPHAPSVSSVHWIKIVSMLRVYSVSSPHWEETLFLQLQTASKALNYERKSTSFQTPQSRTDEVFLARAEQRERETSVVWFVQYIQLCSLCAESCK